MSKKRLHRLTVKVTPQTEYNLERLCNLSGHNCKGRVIDKLVREKMIQLHNFKFFKEDERGNV